ncbi:hypothetical protein ACFVHQ_02280 [Actinomycetes bacterium NPDC127524]
MKHFYMISVCMSAILFLNACSPDAAKTKSQVLNIPNSKQYTTLFVQGVNNNGVSTESTTAFISDHNQLSAFIKKMDKMEVEQPSGKEITDKIKDLNTKGNYIFVLSDKKTMDNKVYTMDFFSDGRILFQEPNGKTQAANGAGEKLMYFSAEKHPELLHEMKKELNITF